MGIVTVVVVVIVIVIVVVIVIVIVIVIVMVVIVVQVRRSFKLDSEVSDNGKFLSNCSQSLFLMAFSAYSRQWLKDNSERTDKDARGLCPKMLILYFHDTWKFACFNERIIERIFDR